MISKDVSKMNSQSLCPHGLKSVMECISKAAILSQPTDIPVFLIQYLSELVRFRESQPETDPNDVSTIYQEEWSKLFLLNMKESKETTTTSTTETSAAPPHLPSQTEVEEAVKTLYKDLAGVKTSSKKAKKTSVMYATPTPPSFVGKVYGRKVPPPFLLVKGEGKLLPSAQESLIQQKEIIESVKKIAEGPLKVLLPITKKSSVCQPFKPLEGTTDNVNRTINHFPILSPIKKETSTPAGFPSKSSPDRQPPKPSTPPMPLVPKRHVLPSIGQMQTNRRQVFMVEGKIISPKPIKGQQVEDPECTARH
uniref:RIIa domain-containing protein n=1 Tax=Labrus bergylta TaxID=56723 RepID=A0A3Q3EY43_9LABR